MRLRALLMVAVLAATTLSVAPASALPPGPPEITLTAGQLGDDLRAWFRITASDPDGAIDLIEVCAPDLVLCAYTPYGSDDIVRRARSCAVGDSKAQEGAFGFDAPGTYSITARVVTSGCPVVGNEETAAVVTSVVIEEAPPPPPPAPIACADDDDPSDGGVGVTEETVSIGMLAAAGGSFNDAWPALAGAEGAVRAINAAGGVCGRRLVLVARDDGNESPSGTYQEMAREVFAFVGMPDPRVLEPLIAAGDVGEAGAPVVGTPAYLDAELGEPLVWPVGASQDTFGVLSFRHAREADARTASIVSLVDERWSEDARDAVRGAVEAEGYVVASDVRVRPGQASYSAEIQQHNAACGCDVVYLLLDARTALTFLAGRPRLGDIQTVLHPRLMGEQFFSSCGRICSGALVWSSFAAPVGGLSDGQARYVHAVQSYSPTVDPASPATMGAYSAVYALAQAMGAAGTAVSRDAVTERLNGDGIALDLTATQLSWDPLRDANRHMRAYRVVAGQGTFLGMAEETGWRART